MNKRISGFRLSFSFTLMLAMLAITASVCAQAKPDPSLNHDLQVLIDAANKDGLDWKDRAAILEKAVQAADRSKDFLGESIALIAKGKCFLEQKMRLEAVQCFSRALDLYRHTGDKPGEADTLNRIGRAEFDLDLRQPSIDWWSVELALRRTIHDRQGEAYVLECIGYVHWIDQRLDQALACYQKSLQLRTGMGDLPGAASSLENMAHIEGGLHHRQQAVTTYTQAIELRKKIGDQNALAASMGGFGGLLDDLGRTPEGILWRKKALALRRTLKDRANIAIALDDLGWLEMWSGREREALTHYNEALAIKQELNDRQGIAGSMDRIGWTTLTLGQYERALQCFQASLAGAREFGYRALEGAELNCIGVVLTNLGQNQQALEYLQQALPVLHDSGNRSIEAGALGNIGRVYQNIGQNEKALEYFALSVAAAKKIDQFGGEARTLVHVGDVYSVMGNELKALATLREALRLAKFAEDREYEGWALYRIGAIYEKLGRTRLAIDFYGKAIPIEREVGSRDKEATVLFALATVCELQARDALGITFGKRAINLTQSLRADITGLDTALQRSFRDTVAERYRVLAEWLAKVGRLAEAEEVIGLLKDEEYVNFLRSRAGAKAEFVDLTSLEVAWMKKYDELGSGLGAVGLELASLEKIPTENRTSAQKNRMRLLDDKAEGAAEAFQTFLAETQGAFRAAGVDTARLEDLQQSRDMQTTLRELRANSPAALYTLVTADGVRVIISVPGLAAARKATKTMISGADLNKKILAFRQTLLDPTLDPRPLGAELYDLLIRPIEKDLRDAKVQTLMWSLDGTLRYVPLWALYDRETKQYLVEKFPSSIFTPRTVGHLVTKPRPWSGVEFGVSMGGKVGDAEFAPLPGVAKELAKVHDSLGGPAPALDAAFTYDAFREALHTNPTVVHMATHFRFKSGDERQSFLLLGGGQSLSVDKLSHMAEGALSSVDLLVLSACETAMTDGADGSEFEGFARLAQQKGASSVMATLWEVADDSTALLMGEFYHLRMGHPEWTKLQALRQAQIEMIEGALGGSGSNPPRSGAAGKPGASGGAPRWPTNLPKYAHPYYWAPFVLFGNWR